MERIEFFLVFVENSFRHPIFSCNKIRKVLHKIKFSVHLCIRIRQRISYIRIQCFRLEKKMLQKLNVLRFSIFLDFFYQFVCNTR